MTQINEQEVMQGVAERFAKAAEELRLSGAQHILYLLVAFSNDLVHLRDEMLAGERHKSPYVGFLLCEPLFVPSNL